MNYAFIKNTHCVNIVVFESEEQADTFKETLIRDKIIDNLVKLEDDSQFGIGDKYEDGKWSKVVLEINLDELKAKKVIETKNKLAEFLENHPLQHNGDYYSVTQEKQSLLTSAIAVYELKTKAGLPAELKWNTTGDICRVYTIEELSGLAFAITDYVQPRVEHQQALEVQINSSTTLEELESIEINYEEVS